LNVRSHTRKDLLKAGAALAASAALAPAAAFAQAPAALVPMRILASPVDDVMPVLWAIKTGMFTKAGLNVTIDRAASGAAAAAAVAGGSIEIGKGNIVSIIAAHAHNVPLVIVAPAAIYDPKTPDAALVVAAGSPIKTAKDLVGKVVGVTSLNDLSAMATQAWMEQNGADWKATQFIEVPYPSLMPALTQNRVQAIVLLKPFITDAVQANQAQVLGLVYNAVSPRFLESIWFTNGDYYASHKEPLTRFAKVVADASAYTNTHPSDTVDLLSSFTSTDPQRATQIPRMVNGTSLQAKEIQPVIDIAAKFKLIPKTFDAQEIIPH
jgi:NitT/TauT family transport system substrate-binding protein